MLNKKQAIIALAAMATTFTACNDADKLKTTKSGYKYYHKVNTKGEKPGVNDIVEFHFSVYNSNDSLLFASDRDAISAPRVALERSGSPYLKEIFRVGAKGDSLLFEEKSQTIFGPQIPPYTQPNEDIKLGVKIIDIMSPEEAEEKQKQQEEEMKAKIEEHKTLDDEEIAKYLKENNLEGTKTENGVYIVFDKKGDGPIPTNNEFIKVMLKGMTLDGKSLGKDPQEPVTFPIGRQQIRGLDEGFKQIPKGSQATIYVPSGLAFGPQRVSEDIGAFSILKFEVEMMDILNKEEYQAEQKALAEKRRLEQEAKVKEHVNIDDQLIQEYLKENNIDAQKTESGLYYVITEKGDGTKPTPGDTVDIHYTGTLLSGEKFDSSLDRGQPFSTVIGKGRVIKGWDEGVVLLPTGSKATFFIPSHLAYGSRGAGAMIKPFSVLKFDVELLGIKKQ
ncbi:FKBP-type peptidyl-prolyl cis-trans isomerase [Algivirga pacifica]|uniref:peptidylprolyl isomerase n=1 Tax=Algivirga pacifica TaxID=1162670 RepID=A0ABP9DK84_9BACT